MQLSFFDYIVIIIAYMFVSMRGDKLMKFVSFNKLSAALPLNKSTSSVLVHAIFFVIILVLINAIAGKIAGYKGKALGCKKACNKSHGL